MYTFSGSVAEYVLAIVIIAGSYVLFSKLLFPATHYKGKPLPPIAPPSAYENFMNKIRQKGLIRVNHIMQQGRVMQKLAAKKNSEAFKYGTAFRLSRIPLLEGTNNFIYVTDYKLARMVLLGDKTMELPEAIKKNNLTSFNFANRNVGNLFTTSSLEERREKARKQLAPAFSRFAFLLSFSNVHIRYSSVSVSVRI